MNLEQYGSNINPPQLLNECRNCKMRFDNSASLANHVKKFCSDSSYADVGKLEQRLQELGHKPFEQNLNFNFQEVKQYIKDGGQGQPMAPGTNPNIGKMNLEDLRNYFQSEHRKFEDISKDAVRAKERELIDGLQDMKKERNFLRQQRMEQDKAMHDLIKELELKKERELRAKLEKEEIQRNLKEIEKTKTNALERDKRRELERLAAERENLRMREEEVIDEIKNLEAKSYEQERRLKEDREKKTQQVNNSEYYGQVMRRKEVEIAKQRGEDIAVLQQKKDNLERDRQRIMEDLDKVKQGDFTSLRKNEASRWVANDIIQRGGGPSSGFDITRVQLDPAVKDKLLTDQVRINHLKQEREKMLREALPELDELDAITRQWMQKNPGNKYNTDPIGDVRRSMIQPNNNGQLTRNEQFNPQKSYQAPRGMGFAAGIESDADVLQKLKQLREEYARDGENDPQFYSQLDDLENHLLNKMNQQNQSPSAAIAQSTIQPQAIMQHDVPPFLPPPMMGPGMYPPPAFGTGQFPVNFHPQMPLSMLNAPQYIPPPPPLMSGAQSIERYNQEHKPEPNPVIVQPYLNPQIEIMNKVIKEQEIQNDLLEKELQNIKQGQGSFQQFDSLVGNTDKDLNQIKTMLGVSKLKGGLRASTKEPFPEDFVFRQNEFRCEDLEVEERALMNLTAQEFDALRQISKLPVNSELYRYKMDQYKELSTMRGEIEKVLQEQRLEKIRRDFEKQKYEDERRFKHEKWLEDQKRQILEAKLKNAGRQQPNDYKPQTAQYQPPMTQQSQQFFEPPRLQSARNQQEQPDYGRMSTRQSLAPPIIKPDTQQDFFKPPQFDIPQDQQPGAFDDEFNPNVYKPERGMNIYYDFASRLQRQFRSMRLVYAVYNVSRSIIPPTLIDIHDAEPDPEDQDKNRIMFKEFNQIKNIQTHPSSNLIIELQVPKPNSPMQEKYVSYGWTILNLFDIYYDLNRGIFKLPIYMSPTKTDIDVRDIPWLKRIPDVILCMRVGNPDDENCRFPVGIVTSPDEYIVPRIHQRPDLIGAHPEEEEEKYDSPNRLEPDQPKEQKKEDEIQSHYECKGINIQLHYARQYVPPTHARVQCTLYDGTSIVKTDDLRMCNWSSKPIDNQNIIFTRGDNPLNVGLSYTPSGMARGEILSIEDETTWIKDLYRLQLDKGRVNDLNLVIQIMEYTKGRTFSAVNEIKQEYMPIGYGVIKLNNKDGTIRFGTYDVELYKPPINITKRNPVDLLKQSLKVTIAQPPFQPSRPQQMAELREQQQQQPLPKPEIQIEPDNNYNQPQKQKSQIDRPFIPNDMKQFNEIKFLDGEGVDFYVDGARFLPENVSYSRILVRAFTIDQYRVINPTKGMADLDVSQGRHPFFGFRQEIRAPKIDPTLTMLITVETIDRSDGLEKIVGYAYFPLFLNFQNKMPVNNRNVSNVLLQSGCYQIPIYATKIPVEKDLTLENIQTLEKIPCSSVLIRCYKAPNEASRVLSIQDVPMDLWRSKGLIVDPPEYQDSAYNTTYCQVSQFERDLFDIKQQRANPPMRQVAQYVQAIKARSQSMSDEALLNWLDKLLVTTPQTSQINLKYISSYEARYGFRFAVERLHNINQKLPHIIITSISPPGSLYKVPMKRTQDVAFFVDYNFDGPWNSLQFNEEIMNYVGLSPNRKLGFIIDVKAVKISGQNVQLLRLT
eukprot:403332092